MAAMRGSDQKNYDGEIRRPGNEVLQRQLAIVRPETAKVLRRLGTKEALGLRCESSQGGEKPETRSLRSSVAIRSAKNFIVRLSRSWGFRLRSQKA